MVKSDVERERHGGGNAPFKSPSRPKIGENASTTTTPLKTSPIKPSAKVRKSLNFEERKPIYNSHSQKSRHISKIEHHEKQYGKGIQYEPSKERKLLKQLYSLIRRKNGKLGGGGAGGAIYGEITQESFQRVVDVLCSKCSFSKNSTFLDIGAGLGKPSFHTSILPGVKLSLGVELIGSRWWQSICLLQNCLEHHALANYARNVFFAHANVIDMNSFDPVTHVYSFNRGFPPDAMKAVAKAFNNSKHSEYFICFDKLNKLRKFGFDVELIEHIHTRMVGSGEQHRCFVYKRIRPVSICKKILLLENEFSNKARTPVQLRTRSARAKATAKIESENKVKDLVSKSNAKRLMNDFVLIHPPEDSQFAPCVPHPSTYMKGISEMKKGIPMYKEWILDQIGLHRTFRISRSNSLK